MRHCAHAARLATPDKSGTAQRVHLEGLLARGVDMLGEEKYATLLAQLEGPERPECLEYLWEQFSVLNGMRAEGMHGLAPFSPESIAAANRLFRWQLTPIEVDGLRQLDLAWRHPELVKDDEETVE